jgi:riboflavin biosynthesis pyrimidine reductase
VQQLFPTHAGHVELLDVYGTARPDRGDRPYVLLNMVASADGATVVSGKTRALGSAGDRRLFLLLRTLVDVVLVGAETVRAEGYGPVRADATAQQRRVAAGLAPLPRIAVCTRRLDLDWSSAFFTDGPRPFVIAPANADADRLARAAGVADVITTPGPRVDLPSALRQIRAAGVTTVLCEGGPALNAQMVEANIVDELCLTISPVLVGAGGGATIVGDARLARMVGMTLTSVLEEEGFLFLRYGLGT